MRTQMLAVSAARAPLLLAPQARDATPAAFLPDLDGFSPRLGPVLLWATAPPPPPHRVQLPAAGRQTADGASDAPVPEGHDGGGAARAGPFPAVSPAADDAFVRPSLGAVEATPGLARAGPLSGAAFAGVTAADDAARFRTVAAGPTRFGRSARDGAPLAPAIGGGATPARLAYHIQRQAVLPPDHVLPPMAVTADYGLLHALLGPAPASGAAGGAAR